MNRVDRDLYIENLTGRIEQAERDLVEANDDVEILRNKMAAAMERRDKAHVEIDRLTELRYTYYEAEVDPS
jgi:hypothetical protein